MTPPKSWTHGATPGPDWPRAEPATRLIAGGALNERRVPDLASELGVSERHLRRAVKNALGVTPLSLAQSCRLLLAKQLLTDTPLPVTQIAFASGFQSLRRFNTVFRERFGLRPGETADVEITSTVPGQGNHPQSPKYLAIPMPWRAWRHLPDEDIRALAAYLKHGLKPVRNLVADSEGPPDFWASEYTPEKVGSWPAPPFPTARERAPQAEAVSRGRRVRGRTACAHPAHALPLLS